MVGYCKLQLFTNFPMSFEVNSITCFKLVNYTVQTLVGTLQYHIYSIGFITVKTHLPELKAIIVVFP